MLPPLCYPCIGEKELPPASYVRQNGRLSVVDDKEEPLVPFPTWDPDFPEERATKYSHLARPMRVTLKAGDMLYLPALW
jgi:jumonji domain-containing protein 7